MGHDPYGDFFERDYLSAGDFVRQYGVDKNVHFRILGFGTRETRIIGGKRGDPQKAPKPVIWFVEHPTKPMFMNRSNHEVMLDRFGEEHWTPERHKDIVYAPVTLRATEDRGGREGVQFIVSMHRGPYPDHRAPLGAEVAKKIMDALGPLDFTRDKFRRFVQQEHRELVPILDACGELEEWPRLMAQVLDEWRREARSDTSRRGTAEPPVRHANNPPAKAEDHGGHSGGFLPPDAKIDKDDIPF